jgi:hypothetical protein
MEIQNNKVYQNLTIVKAVLRVKFFAINDYQKSKEKKDFI